MKKLTFIAITSAVLALVGCEKYSLDRQMESLCKKDGGVRVYETVTLPQEMFDQWGDPFPGWRGRKPEDRLGPDYRFEMVFTRIKPGDGFKGEGELRRFAFHIYRRSDTKLMGEAVSYGRFGGDFIPFAHPSSNSCPVKQSESDLIRAVFLKAGA